MKKILLLLAATCALMTAQAATYKVRAKGQDAGRAELTIQQDATSYQVSLSLHPMFLAKLFLDDMVDIAKGTIIKGQFSPNHYNRTNKKGKSLFRVNFQQTIAMIDDTKKGKKQLNIDIKGQDPLSQIAQIRHDLKQGKLQPDYYLVTHRNQQHYKAVAKGGHVVLTEYPSKRRQIQLWFDNQFELRKMQKNKAGKEDFFMVKK